MHDAQLLLSLIFCKPVPGHNCVNNAPACLPTRQLAAGQLDFLAKVSHEVRTPLNSIIGFAELMLHERFGPIGNTRYKGYAEDIHQSGLYALSWTDSAPPSDVPLYYVVRAENNETCSDGPANGGVTDGNLVYVSATDATSQAPPGEVGATLILDPVNQAHVRLEWEVAPAAARYHVYRSTSPDGGFARIAEPVDPLHEDSGALDDGQSRYYLVLAADACGNEE